MACHPSVVALTAPLGHTVPVSFGRMTCVSGIRHSRIFRGLLFSFISYKTSCKP